jgi:exonuclease III
MVIGFTPVNERISCLRVRGKFFNCSIINVHAPTEEKPEEGKGAFYEVLEKIYDECPRGDIKIVLGDMNAQIGKEDIYIPTIGKHSLHSQSNDNVLRLINFAASRSMEIGSTIFCHKNMHKATWKSPDGETMNQMDHILIDVRHKSNLMDLRTLRGANIDSDH